MNIVEVEAYSVECEICGAQAHMPSAHEALAEDEGRQRGFRVVDGVTLCRHCDPKEALGGGK